MSWPNYDNWLTSAPEYADCEQCHDCEGAGGFDEPLDGWFRCVRCDGSGEEPEPMKLTQDEARRAENWLGRFIAENVRDIDLCPAGLAEECGQALGLYDTVREEYPPELERLAADAIAWWSGQHPSESKGEQ